MTAFHDGTVFPTSNVRIVPAPFHVLTEDSFGGCEECADGVHGRLREGTEDSCACCYWPRDPQYRVGYRLPARGKS